MTQATTAELGTKASSPGGILIVEDDPDIRETLRLLLEDAGYPVFTAANGRDALAVLGTPRPACLILLDLMMPVMSGTEFLEVLRQDEALAPIPVVVVSAWPREGLAMTDIQGFVKKPVDFDKLLTFVRKYC